MQVNLNNLIGKSVLLVGGSGFIGTSLAKYLSQSGVNVVSTFYKNRSKLKHINQLQLDLSNESSLITLKEYQFDYVINCSGYIDHSFDLNKYSAILNDHFFNILRLLGSLDLSRLKFFVQLGSSTEYGCNPAPQSEEMRENPKSYYGLAKVCATHLMKLVDNIYGIPTATVRLFLAYGPYQNINRLIPYVITNCINAKTFDVSAGDQLRDFCFIDDIIEGIISIINMPDSRGEVFNLASGNPIKVRHLIEMIVNLIGAGNPRYGKVNYRPDENIELYANIEKIFRYTEWRPKISIDQGLKKTIQWYINNTKNDYAKYT